jgi:hypothetical protein
MTTREELVERLLALPERLAEAEREALEEARLLAVARRNLQLAEDWILLAKREDGSPELDGKNEAQRAAQLRLLTKPERDQVELREERQARAVAELRALQAESSCLRAAARLMGAGELPWAGALDIAA